MREREREMREMREMREKNERLPREVENELQAVDLVSALQQRKTHFESVPASRLPLFKFC